MTPSPPRLNNVKKTALFLQDGFPYLEKENNFILEDKYRGERKRGNIRRRIVYFGGEEETEKEKEGNIWRRKISLWPRKKDDGEG